MKPKITFRKFFGHLKTVWTHRHWVKYFCRLAGIPGRGWKHDLSKYSPTEFWESVRYWDGKISPIVRCKEENGFSFAWMHHKGRNSHHYEYWMDRFDYGGMPIPMPKDDFVEQVCDFIAAGITYNGKWYTDFKYTNELEWWKKKKEHCSMHPINQKMLDIIFEQFAQVDTWDHNIVDNMIKSGYIQEVWCQAVHEAVFKEK